VVCQVGRRLRHAPGTTRRAELSPLAEAHRPARPARDLRADRPDRRRHRRRARPAASRGGGRVTFRASSFASSASCKATFFFTAATVRSTSCASSCRRRRDAVRAGATVRLGCDHTNYPAHTEIGQEMLASLAGDLR